MCVEEDYTYDNGGTPGLDLTRYGVGARGIDLIERIVNQGAPSVTFPLYDGHGNMTATLSRSGASFTVSNQRSYDVWGGVRSGATSGFPNTRYVANLGHKQDDESDLIYMRARYYEPWTGRFISEDPARDGINWLVYASSDPVNLSDASGESGTYVHLLWAALVSFVLAVVLLGLEVNLERIAYKSAAEIARKAGEAWKRLGLPFDQADLTDAFMQALRKSPHLRYSKLAAAGKGYAMLAGYLYLIEYMLLSMELYDLGYTNLPWEDLLLP